MRIWSELYSDLFFHSPLSGADCMRILRDAESVYGDPLNPGLAESRMLDNGWILLIFKGRRFSKAVRTEYLASFTDEPDGCTITLKLHHELLGLPPMTSAQDIAQFLGEKLQAIQITT